MIMYVEQSRVSGLSRQDRRALNNQTLGPGLGPSPAMA